MDTIIRVSITFVVVVFFKNVSIGQKYDRNWLGGEYLPGILMVFEDSGIQFQQFGDTIDFFVGRGNIAMSNKDGELQFFTNGNVIAEQDGEIMAGGKGFNQGATNDDFLNDPPWYSGPDTTWNSNYNPYTYQVLPDPYNDSFYYMIHAFIR
ncbi:MAG: hypothetical protein ACE5FF_09510, partial [Saprospiraceae bacterium]